jgi:hypothetical protein
MAQYYNHRCTLALVYKIGDMVYLDSWDIRTTRPSQKLAHCYLGPYKVEKCVGTHAYCLKLPAAMSRLHPVFHVVKLLPALRDPIPGWRPTTVPEPELIDGEEHYKVEEILDSQLFQNKLQYLVAWKGYGYEENTWANAEDVNAKELIQEFSCANPGAPRRICQVHFTNIRFHSVHEDVHS